MSRRSQSKGSLINIDAVEPRVGHKGLVVCGPRTTVSTLVHDPNDVYVYNIDDASCGKELRGKGVKTF